MVLKISVCIKLGISELFNIHTGRNSVAVLLAVCGHSDHVCWKRARPIPLGVLDPHWHPVLHA